MLFSGRTDQKTTLSLERIFITISLFMHTINAYSLHSTAALINRFDSSYSLQVVSKQGKHNNYRETKTHTALLRGRSALVRNNIPSSTALFVERTSLLDGFRERARYDNQFTKKLTVELFVGFLAQLLAEISQRGDNSWNETDLIIADLVQGLIANFFAVYLSAPRKTTRSYGIGKKTTGFSFWDSLPDNAFQKCKLGTEYSLLQRSGSLLKASPKLFSIGFVSMTVGSLLIDFLGLFRSPWTLEAFSEVVISSPSNFEHVLTNALATGVYVAISTNLRYQFVAGALPKLLCLTLLTQPISHPLTPLLYYAL